MSKMMPNITNKLRRKKPSVTVESPSGKEPDAKESKSLVKAATGALPCRIIAYRLTLHGESIRRSRSQSAPSSCRLAAVQSITHLPS